MGIPPNLLTLVGFANRSLSFFVLKDPPYLYPRIRTWVHQRKQNGFPYETILSEWRTWPSKHASSGDQTQKTVRCLIGEKEAIDRFQRSNKLSPVSTVFSKSG